MAGPPGAKEPVTHLVKKEFREESLAGSRHALLNTSHSAEGKGSSSFHLCDHKQQTLKIHCGLGLHSSGPPRYIIYKALTGFPFVNGPGDGGCHIGYSDECAVLWFSPHPTQVPDRGLRAKERAPEETRKKVGRWKRPPTKAPRRGEESWAKGASDVRLQRSQGGDGRSEVGRGQHAAPGWARGVREKLRAPGNPEALAEKGLAGPKSSVCFPRLEVNTHTPQRAEASSVTLHNTRLGLLLRTGFGKFHCT